MAQRAVPYFYVLEHTTTGHLHAHALVWGTRHLSIEQIEHAWKHGFTDVRIYDASRGFSYYVAKDLLERAPWFDLSTKMPPRLKRAA